MEIKKIFLLKGRQILMMLFIGIFGLCFQANGQKEKERTRIKLYFAKMPNGEKKITVGLLAGSGRDMHNVAGADVLFTASANDSTVELASIATNDEGKAILEIASGYKFPVDEEGKTLFEASFDGDDSYRSASNELEVSDLNFDITFDIEDSVKYVHVVANQIMPSGEKMPVEALDINMGVARLFSILPIGQIETDENGMASLEFPNDIPGDSTGAITVIARIEDNDNFATVEQRGNVDWGIPVSYEIKPLPRKLWTDEAPLWMIFSVFVVLTGAWYHFFLSVYKLNKIRKIKEEPV